MSDASTGSTDAMPDGGRDVDAACAAADFVTSVMSIPGSDRETINAVSPNPVDGSLFVAGYFAGDAFDTSPPSPASGFHFVLRSDPGGLAATQLRVYPTTVGNVLLDAFVDQHGSVTLGGTLNWGISTIERRDVDASGGGQPTGLVVRLVAGMAPSIETIRSPGGYVAVRATSRRGDGYFAAGDFVGEMTIGGQTCVSDTNEAFVAAFTFEGTLDWLRCFGGPGTQRVFGVAMHDAGEAYVVGTFTDAISLDGAHTTPARGASDGFVARLSGGGEPRWIRAVGTDDPRLVEQLTRVDVWGSRVLAVGVVGDGDLGVPSDPALGGDDGALVALDLLTGDVDRVVRIGGPGQDALRAISVDRCGSAWVGGSIGDGGVVRRIDAGSLVPSFDLFDASSGAGLDVTAIGAFSDGHAVLVAGTYEGAPTLAGTTLPIARGPSDLFLMRLAR